jgi:hypothetical protein
VLILDASLSSAANLGGTALARVLALADGAAG